VVLIDAEPMEPEGGTTTVDLFIAPYSVSCALKDLGIKGKMDLIDKKRLRVEVAGANAVFVGLKAVDVALSCVSWNDQQGMPVVGPEPSL